MQMSKKNVDIFRDVMQINVYNIWCNLKSSDGIRWGEPTSQIRNKTWTMEQLAAGNVKAEF